MDPAPRRDVDRLHHPHRDDGGLLCRCEAGPTVRSRIDRPEHLLLRHADLLAGDRPPSRLLEELLPQGVLLMVARAAVRRLPRRPAVPPAVDVGLGPHRQRVDPSHLAGPHAERRHARRHLPRHAKLPH